MDIQDLPLTSSEERQHILDRSCWCNPTVQDVPAGSLYHHICPELSNVVRHNPEDEAVIDAIVADSQAGQPGILVHIGPKAGA